MYPRKYDRANQAYKRDIPERTGAGGNTNTLPILLLLNYY